jgi:hypothetical protein
VTLLFTDIEGSTRLLQTSVIATVTPSHSTAPSCAMRSRPSAAPRSTLGETPVEIDLLNERSFCSS